MWTAILLSLVAIVNAPSIRETIEVRIGSRIVSTFDIQELADHLILQNPLMERKVATQAARERLIERVLIEEYLARFEMQATDREVNQMASARNLSSFMREELRSEMNRSRFNSLAFRNAAKTPTTGELREYFNKNKAAFSNNFEVTLAECRISEQSNNSEVAKKINYYSKNPKAFSTCVAKDSVGPTKDQGGLIGTVRSGDLTPDLEALVFSLESGDVTVVKMPQMSQIIKVLKKVDLGPVTFDSVKDRVRAEFEEDIAKLEVEKLLTRLKADPTIIVRGS